MCPATVASRSGSASSGSPWTAASIRSGAVIRQDGRLARPHNDAHFARSVCAHFACAYGLDEPGPAVSVHHSGEVPRGDHSRLPPIFGPAKSRNLRILSP